MNEQLVNIQHALALPTPGCSLSGWELPQIYLPAG